MIKIILESGLYQLLCSNRNPVKKVLGIEVRFNKLMVLMNIYLILDFPIKMVKTSSFLRIC